MASHEHEEETKRVKYPTDPNSYENLNLQTGVDSSSGLGMGVNKDTMLPTLMALKESLEEETRQVRSLINMIQGEEVEGVDQEDQMAQEIQRLRKQLNHEGQMAQEIQRLKKELADEQEKSVELEVQIEVMKLSGGS